MRKYCFLFPLCGTNPSQGILLPPPSFPPPLPSSSQRGENKAHSSTCQASRVERGKGQAEDQGGPGRRVEVLHAEEGGFCDHGPRRGELRAACHASCVWPVWQELENNAGRGEFLLCVWGKERGWSKGNSGCHTWLSPLQEGSRATLAGGGMDGDSVGSSLAHILSLLRKKRTGQEICVVLVP